MDVAVGVEAINKLVSLIAEVRLRREDLRRGGGGKRFDETRGGDGGGGNGCWQSTVDGSGDGFVRKLGGTMRSVGYWRSGSCWAQRRSIVRGGRREALPK